MVTTCSDPARRQWPWRTLVVAFTMGLLFLTASTASAQDRLQQAREHFERGKDYYSQKQYDLALEELMKAFVLDPKPELVYNIARVHEDKGNLEDAIKFFKNYLKIAPKAPNRRDVRRRIKQLQRELARRPKPGFLTVITTPPKATVRVNGKPVGESPIDAMPLPPGRYPVEVSLEDFRPHRAEVVIDTGRTTVIQTDLQDAPSAVFVATIPNQARATILAPRPQDLGACPCVAELPAGKYQMQVTHPGHQPKTLEFVKRPGETLKLNVTLVPVETTGQLMVEATVPGAEVRVDGTALGRTPLQSPLPIRPGDVTIEVVARGYRTWRGRATVRLGELTRVQAILDPGPAAISDTPTVYEDSSGGSSAQRTAGWALTGVGIGVLVGGGLMTTFAHVDRYNFENGTYFQATDQNGQGILVRQDLTRADALALQDRADALEVGAIVAYSVGGAALLTGIILLATDSSPAEAPLADTRIDVGPLEGGGMVSVTLPFD